MPTKRSPDEMPGPHARALTGLEHELLGYVERLTNASEVSAQQFRELEQRSSGSIATRLAALEHGMRSLIASHISWIEALNTFATDLPGSENAWRDLRAAVSALNEAASRLTDEAERANRFREPTDV